MNDQIFFIQIDKNNNVSTITHDEHFNQQGWYQVFIDKRHLQGFKDNYKEVKYNTETSDLNYPSDFDVENELSNNNDTKYKDLQNQIKNLPKNDNSSKLNDLQNQIDKLPKNNNDDKIKELNTKVESMNDNITKLMNKVYPLNIFPNYWIDSTHGDFPTIKVPVQKGQQYNFSFVISNNPSKTPIRASSSWNIGDQWGSLVSNDSGATNNNSVYKVTFTAPKSGNMPIQIMFTNIAHAQQNGGASLMVKRIVMTQTYYYIPYLDCNNGNQSIKDITGDAGMDAKAMFGNL